MAAAGAHRFVFLSRLTLCLMALIFELGVLGASIPPIDDRRSPYLPSRTTANVAVPVHETGFRTREADIIHIDIRKVGCGYAISGSYCLLQRLLFYAVGIFVFSFRFHKWLTAAGIASLVTYTTTAAFHGIFLALDPNIGYDFDYVALTSIISASVFLSTNFIFFAPKMIQAKAKILIAVWGIVLAIVSVVMAIRAPDFWSHSFSRPAAEVCASHESCVDTCSPNMHPPLFRSKNENTVPIFYGIIDSMDTNDTIDLAHLAANTSSWLQSSAKGKAYDKEVNGYFWPIFLKVVLLPSILLQTTIVNIFMTPKIARNQIFKKLTAQKDEVANHRRAVLLIWRTVKSISRVIFFVFWPLQLLYELIRLLLGRWIHMPSVDYLVYKSWLPTNATPTQQLSQRRRLTAQALSLSWYLWANLAYLAWPAFFLYKVVNIELYMATTRMPEQESPQNAGQWLPCLTVAFAILIAIGHRIRDPESKVHDIWTMQGKERPSERLPPRWLCGWEEGWYWVTLLQEEWGDFVAWWRDPMTISWRVMVEELEVHELGFGGHTIVKRTIRYPTPSKKRVVQKRYTC